MSLHRTKPEHEVAYQDLCALMNKHADKLSAIELLAVASNMLGKLLAMQDQRITSVDLAKETMVRNIEHGNKQAVDQLMKSEGRA